MSAIKSDALSGVTDLFYEAAVTPRIWPEALDALSDALSAKGAVLSQFGGSTVPLPSCTNLVSFATEYVDREWFQRDHLRQRSVDRKLVNGFYHASDVYSPEEWASDILVTTFIQRHGCGDYVFAHFWGLLGDTVTLRIYRAAGQGPFDEGICQKLNACFAHFRRALSLSVQLGLSRGAGLLDGLSTVKCGAALLDSHGHIYKSNSLADEILDRYSISRRGRLATGDGKAQSRLDGQIADAIDARLDNDSDHGDFVVVRGHKHSQPLIIQVVPIRSRDDVFRSVRAIMLFNDLNLEQGMRSDLLTAVLDLRPSEARVASLLAMGRSLDEIGAELKLRRETVRSYVKNILSKARVNKQSAFVAVAGRIGASGMGQATDAVM